LVETQTAAKIGAAIEMRLPTAAEGNGESGAFLFYYTLLLW